MTKEEADRFINEASRRINEGMAQMHLEVEKRVGRHLSWGYVPVAGGCVMLLEIGEPLEEEK